MLHLTKYGRFYFTQFKVLNLNSQFKFKVFQKIVRFAFSRIQLIIILE